MFTQTEFLLHNLFTKIRSFSLMFIFFIFKMRNNKKSFSFTKDREPKYNGAINGNSNMGKNNHNYIVFANHSAFSTDRRRVISEQWLTLLFKWLSTATLSQDQLSPVRLILMFSNSDNTDCYFILKPFKIKYCFHFFQTNVNLFHIPFFCGSLI